MSKKKFNYAIVRSIFGEIWIGKTKLPVDKGKVFEDINGAIESGKGMFESNHPEFDVDDEDNNDVELQEQYNNIADATEDEVDVIKGGVEKFIVKW